MNVCSLNIIPVLHHVPVPFYDLLTQCKPPNKVNVLSQVMWFSLVELWGRLVAFSHVLFEFDNPYFLSVTMGVVHHYRKRGHEPRADLVTGERRET